MRLVRQVEDFEEWLSASVVKHDRLWNRSLALISEDEIQLFYARWSIQGQRQAAFDAIDRLQAALITQSFYGTIPAADCATVVMHSMPEPAFVADDLVRGLVKISQSRRRAVLFALETMTSPDKVHLLTWHELRRMHPA